MRGFVEFTFSKNEVRDFEAKCQVAIRNLGSGTKRATTATAQEIMAESKMQVPKESGTLLSSAFYEVHRRTDIGGYSYEATLGYGGNGDPINPITGKPASYYMVAVHERLDVSHPAGKAKFLEDPMREYANANFQRTVFTYAQESLADISD